MSGLASKLRITVETIEKGVIITNSFRDSALVNRVYHRCPLKVQGQFCYSNLMELPLYGFDMILGMDCLTEHKAMIESELKKVTFRSKKGKKVVVVSERA